MTPQEAFAYGFLFRCAEEGLTAAQRQTRMDKAAGVFGGVLDVGKALGTTGLALGTMGVAGAAGVGALAGYGASRLGEQDIDPEEIHKQELAQTYRLYAQHLLRRAAAAKLQAGAKPRYQPY